MDDDGLFAGAGDDGTFVPFTDILFNALLGFAVMVFIAFALIRPDANAGTIDLKASTIAKLKGKAAPEWVITDARGVKADVKLADYKGKWVYIKFWGYW